MNKNSPKNLKMAKCYSIFASLFDLGSSNSTLIHHFFDSTTIWLRYQRLKIAYTMNHESGPRFARIWLLDINKLWKDESQQFLQYSML